MKPARKKMATTTKLDPNISKHIGSILRYFEGIKEPTERKDTSELKNIQADSTKMLADVGSDGACWFKDSNGSDICYPYPPAECRARGGQPVPGDCPNFFAAMKAARSLSRTIAKGSGSTTAETKKRTK